MRKIIFIVIGVLFYSNVFAETGNFEDKSTNEIYFIKGTASANLCHMYYRLERHVFKNKDSITQVDVSDEITNILGGQLIGLIYNFKGNYDVFLDGRYKKCMDSISIDATPNPQNY